MKKSIRLSISLLLVIATIFSSSFAVYAGKIDDNKVVITTIGDSVSQGHTLFPVGYSESSCNMPNDKLIYTGDVNHKYDRDKYIYLVDYIDNAIDPEDVESNRQLVAKYEKAMLNSYSAQLALALNCTPDQIKDIDTFEEFNNLGIYKSLTCNALRTVDVRAALDERYYNRIEKNGFDYLWNNSPEIPPVHRVMTKENIETKIKEADILLYSLGGADIFYAPFMNTVQDSASAISEIEINLESVVKLIVEIRKGFAQYKENTIVLISDFIRMNPDIDIVIPSLFNPFLDNDISHLSFNLEEDATVLLKNSISVMVDDMDEYFRTVANIFPNVRYVDINGLQCIEKDAEGNTVSGDGVHPSTAGHQYIARRIMSALPDKYINGRPCDISVDLYGSCKENDEITAVYVNGIKTDKYEKDGYAVTIHHKWLLAKTVTVVTKGEKVGINTWKCNWNCSDGYHTYTMFKISDCEKTKELFKSKLNIFNK